ncbi:HAD family hydrolase [Amycolatopsis lurida]
MSVTTAYVSDLPLEWTSPVLTSREPGPDAGVVVWDLDLVLLPSRRLDREAHRVAFARVTGKRPVHEPPMLDQTDPLFAVDLLCQNGFARIGARRSLPTYLPALTAAYRALAKRRPWLLPRPCPDAFARLRRSAPQRAFITTKLRPSAVLTLAATGLDRYLDPAVGAFGSDHVNRSKLTEIALARAERAYGLSA